LVLVSTGVGTLIYGLVEGGSSGWTALRSLLGVTIGVLLIVGFVWWENRTADPMIPLGLFRRVEFTAAVGTQFLMASAIFSGAFLTSQYFQFARGYSPLGTGLRFLPWTATPLIVAPIAGAMFDKVGGRALSVPGLAMQAVGFIWIAELARHHAAYASFVAPFIIAGTGISMALPCVTASGLNAVRPTMLGKAAGTLNTMQQFGAVFGIAIVSAVFDSNGSLANGAAVASGFRPALGAAAGLSLLAAATAFGLARRPSR
jgi:hypothetical protein